MRPFHLFAAIFLPGMKCEISYGLNFRCLCGGKDESSVFAKKEMEIATLGHETGCLHLIDTMSGILGVSLGAFARYLTDENESN
jgi:hypothetical protein